MSRNSAVSDCHQRTFGTKTAAANVDAYARASNIAGRWWNARGIDDPCHVSNGADDIALSAAKQAGK
eukprot:6200955-Pleurochrysis_carterae.AAC.2